MAPRTTPGVALLAAALATAASEPNRRVDAQPPLGCADVVLGAATGVSRGTHGYELFLTSLRAAAPDAAVVLLVDAASEAALAATPAAAAWGARLTLRRVKVTDIPLVARRPGRELSMQLARYWFYVDALEELSARYAAEAAAAAAAGTPAPRRWCASPPLVLLSDTRDVVFQRSPFDDMRRLGAASTTSRSRPPLYAFSEPARYTNLGPATAAQAPPAVDDALWRRFLAGDADAINGDVMFWNTRVASSIARPAVWAPFARLPVLCSGTTAGALPALLAYARTVAAALPSILSGGQGYLVGADQPLHQLLLWTAAAAAEAAAQQKVADGVTRDAGLCRQLAALVDDTARLSAAEPYFRSLAALATSLADSVALTIVPHEDGLVCTLGLFPTNQVATAPRLPRGRPDTGGGGSNATTELAAATATVTAAGEASSSDGVDGNVDAFYTAAVLPTDVVGSNDDDGAGMTALPSPLPLACAVVHQYDRHMSLWKWADVRWGGLDARNSRYCDIFVHLCW